MAPLDTWALVRMACCGMAWLTAAAWACGQDTVDLKWPPRLPGGRGVITEKTDRFLVRPEGIAADVQIARTAPEVDFLYYPGQDYPGNPWSVWGDSLAVGDMCYSAIGDHKAPQGNAFLYSYHRKTRRLRQVVDLQKLLQLPAGHYAPGKIHSRIDLGSDGWLYFATHRGSTRVTTSKYHYHGDWIVRHHPETGKTEVVVRGPIPNHCIPTSVLDPTRLIFYGGTAAGDYSDKTIMFFAYDVRRRRVLHSMRGGPYRYLILARSTGRVYFCNSDDGTLWRYDPKTGQPPVALKTRLGLRSATEETTDGFVYTVSTRRDGTIWRFNTRTESAERIGQAAVGRTDYVTSLDVDPSGRFLYYTPGAHGGAQHDGTPIVQFDTRTLKKKVIAFLHPHYQRSLGYVCLGTFGSSLSPDGATLYVTWNGNRAGPQRGRHRFDTCALTAIHIPESERVVDHATQRHRPSDEN